MYKISTYMLLLIITQCNISLFLSYIIMKILFRHIFSFTMIVVLLTSTTGISINKMECLKTGIVKFSTTEFNDCSNNSSDNSFNTKCCDYHKIVLDLDYDTIIKANFINVFSISLNLLQASLFNNPKKISNKQFNFFTNLPPPSGYSLLKLVQVFRL